MYKYVYKSQGKIKKLIIESLQSAIREIAVAKADGHLFYVYLQLI